MATQFYHTDRGYWETVVDATSEQEASFPPDTVRVLTPKPSQYHRFDVATLSWVDETPTPTEADVEAERDRRLLLGKAFSITGYANTIRVSATDTEIKDLLFQFNWASVNPSSNLQWRDKDKVIHTLTGTQFLALYSAAATYAGTIKATTWTIAALDPIPADYADDSRWPT